MSPERVASLESELSVERSRVSEMGQAQQQSKAMQQMLLEELDLLRNQQVMAEERRTGVEQEANRFYAPAVQTQPSLTHTSLSLTQTLTITLSEGYQTPRALRTASARDRGRQRGLADAF